MNKTPITIEYEPWVMEIPAWAPLRLNEVVKTYLRRNKDDRYDPWFNDAYEIVDVDESVAMSDPEDVVEETDAMAKETPAKIAELIRVAIEKYNITIKVES